MKDSFVNLLLASPFVVLVLACIHNHFRLYRLIEDAERDSLLRRLNATPDEPMLWQPWELDDINGVSERSKGE